MYIEKEALTAIIRRFKIKHCLVSWYTSLFVSTHMHSVEQQQVAGWLNIINQPEKKYNMSVEIYQDARDYNMMHSTQHQQGD